MTYIIDRFHCVAQIIHIIVAQNYLQNEIFML